ncbi:NAC domain-containing protein 1-like [Mercurialis annua]|uniref:NAC domain-containing protein 1-like n=1 Tax=Mercurialis annua TaxID=3986 RepID=UPI00215FEDD3|nr:NAC domain-containing protein 1-like [Mercurialis annua]
MRMSSNQNQIPNTTRRLSEEELAYFKSFPCGYRFWPTDTELILEYLHKKVYLQPLPRNRIITLHFYNFNPQFLAEMYSDYGEKEWYFFTPRAKKCNNGLRAAGDGYWRGAGADELIRHNGVIIGRKNAFVFYMAQHPNDEITDWIMHEFVLENPPPTPLPRLDDCVLCRIYKKCERFARGGGDEYEDIIDQRVEEIDNNKEIIRYDNNSGVFEPDIPYELPFGEYDFPGFIDDFPPPRRNCSLSDELLPGGANNYNNQLNENIVSIPAQQVSPKHKRKANMKLKCMHCEITETPKWRDGPMGPKTLCNACGVRYRSGRLYNNQLNENIVLVPAQQVSPEHKRKTNMKLKCMHCEITETPKWREGPMGPKTLCNACGVRYRSGRLCPQYRPAASPTFVPSVHSNVHKRVIRMQKELVDN